MVSPLFKEKPTPEDWVQVAKFCRHLTPKKLADRLAIFILAGNPKVILDPCYGEGALIEGVLRRIKKFKVEKKLEITACDVLDGECDKSLLKNNIRIIRSDFLLWNDSLSIDKGVDAIICNPPYVGNRDLPFRVRSSIQSQLKSFGLKLPGNTNYWVYFLLHSLSHLRKGGRIAFILPTSWKYADYAIEIRKFIQFSFKKVKEESLPESVFEMSREGTELLFASGYIGQKEVQKYQYKKNYLAEQKASINCIQIINKKTILLGQILKINIGIVTGDVKFFLLKKSQMESLGISQRYVVPALSSSKQP